MKLKMRGVLSTRYEEIEPFTTQIVAPKALFPTLIAELNKKNTSIVNAEMSS